MCCPGATAIGGGFFTTNSLTAKVTNFNCSGNESRLYDCPFDHMPSGGCVHDAAVVCQGKKLSNTSVLSGREIILTYQQIPT